jgi:hypothetical protein
MGWTVFPGAPPFRKVPGGGASGGSGGAMDAGPWLNCLPDQPAAKRLPKDASLSS